MSFDNVPYNKGDHKAFKVVKSLGASEDCSGLIWAWSKAEATNTLGSTIADIEGRIPAFEAYLKNRSAQNKDYVSKLQVVCYNTVDIPNNKYNPIHCRRD